MKQSKRSRRQDSQDGIMTFDVGRQAKVTKYTTRGKEGFDINSTSVGLSKQLEIHQSTAKRYDGESNPMKSTRSQKDA